MSSIEENREIVLRALEEADENTRAVGTAVGNGNYKYYYHYPEELATAKVCACAVGARALGIPLIVHDGYGISFNYARMRGAIGSEGVDRLVWLNDEFAQTNEGMKPKYTFMQIAGKIREKGWERPQL